jgi:hypothetical protein
VAVVACTRRGARGKGHKSSCSYRARAVPPARCPYCGENFRRVAAYISKFPTSQLSPGPPSVARSAGAGLREQPAVVLRGESAPSALIEIDAVAAGADRARRPRLPRKPTRTRPRPREWSPVTLYQDVAESKLASSRGGYGEPDPERVVRGRRAAGSTGLAMLRQMYRPTSWKDGSESSTDSW